MRDEKTTRKQAHLVFADTQSQNEKLKELEFLPTHQKENDKIQEDTDRTD